MRRSNYSAPILPRAPPGTSLFFSCLDLFITFFLTRPVLINHFNPFIFECPALSLLHVRVPSPFLSHTFWTPGLPEGVLSNCLCPWSVRPSVRPSVRWSVGPSVNISETVHWFFLIFCMKLEHHKGTKVTEPDF